MEARRPFQVRPATRDDVDAFRAHRGALFGEALLLAPGPEAERLDAATRVAFRSAVELGTCLAWLALAREHAHEPVAVGSCALHLVERLPSPRNASPVEGYLTHLYVVPAWRRAGVGAELVRAALDAARARDLGRVRLHATEPGRALYERLGFRVRTNEMERGVGPGDAESP